MRVLVIGAGPSGMAFLYQMEQLRLAGKETPEVVCFDKQADWGGLWRYNWRTGLDEYGERVHNSQYRYLFSNSPKEASLEFPDYTYKDHFGKSIPSFPPRDVLFDYLTGRWNHLNLRRYIKFERVVREVKYIPEIDKFTVTSKSLKENVMHPAETFDYVINATGHFSVPNVPQFEGLDNFPGRIMHSHDFRDAREFKGKRICIVGAHYSAEDIAMQTIKFGGTKVTTCYRTTPMGFKWPEKLNIDEKPLITRVEGATVHFRDGSKDDYDVIVMATGYLHYYPYLEESLRMKGKNDLYPDNLYKGILWMDGGSNKMIYIGVQDQYYTYTMFDAQALWAAKYIIGEIKTPDCKEMQKDIKMWIKRLAALKDMHEDIDFQTDYVNMLSQESGYGHNLDCAQQLHDWEEHKKEDILTFRDRSHRSNYTGEMSPIHHTPFMEAFDDSLECYLAEKP